MERKSDKYLNYIRNLSCVYEGEHEGVIHAHHEPVGKLNEFYPRLDDYCTVPLCFKHHRERHDIGNFRLFWHKPAKKFKVAEYVYLATLVLTLLKGYVEENFPGDRFLLRKIDEALVALELLEEGEFTEANARDKIDEAIDAVYQREREGYGKDSQL